MTTEQNLEADTPVPSVGGMAGYDWTPPASRAKPPGRALAAVVICGWLLVVFSLLMTFVPLPYYRMSPGRSFDVEPLLNIEGPPTYEHDGRFLLTTVSVAPLNGWQWLASVFDSHDELVRKEQMDGDHDPEEIRRINEAMMESSKLVATVVALRELGYEVTVTGDGAEIVSVTQGVPAAGVLSTGDLLVGVEGTPVKTARDATTALADRRPGDQVGLEVEGPDGSRRTVSVEMVPREEDPTKAMVGIRLDTRNVKLNTPFPVDVTTRDIGGPSAGLVYTLGIIDDLSPEDLAAGHRIAATGTMEPDGAVGAIGGVEQKVIAVESAGADLFLVPRDNYDAAAATATRVKVVAVDDIEGALAAIRDFTGVSRSGTDVKPAA